MARNRVQIVVDARDRASSVFDRLGGTITGSILKANALMAAIEGAIGLAGRAGRAFTDAAKIQESNIATAGDLMNIMGISYEESIGFIDSFTEKMALVAADLPGQTAQYVELGRTISDDLANAFIDASGKLDRSGFEENLKRITELAGFRAAANDIDSGLAALGINKFLQGRSFAELQKLKFFEANPAVLNAIEREAEKLGRDLDAVSSRQRAEILRRALEVPDEVIEASSQSISGLVEGFRSSLFDPQSGLFGLLRDLSPEEGNQNVLGSINDTLKILIGDEGLFTVLGKTLNELGIQGGDPLVFVRNGIEGFNNWLTRVTGAFRLFNRRVDFIDPQEALGKLGDRLMQLLIPDFDLQPSQLGERASDFLNSIWDRLGALDFASLLKDAGDFLSDAFNTGLQEGSDFIQNFDYGQVTETIGNLTSALAAELFDFIKGISLSDIENLGGSIGAGIADILSGIANWISSVDWTQVIVGAGEISRLVIEGAARLVGGFLGGLSTLFDQINWDEWRQQPLEIINGFVGALGDSLSWLWQKLTEAVRSLSSIFTFNNQNAVTNRIRQTDEDVSGIPDRSNVNRQLPNRANGFLGNLIGAAMREKQAVPNAGIVVANSTEAILNRSQQAAVSDAIRLGSNSSGISIGNISVVSNGSNAVDIADDVIREIENRLIAFQQNRLTPAYT
ncbi:MAG: hypothetical protein ACFE0I_02545 [Elainellaceae cyanobacterium]